MFFGDQDSVPHGPNLILNTPDLRLQCGQDLSEGLCHLPRKTRNGEAVFLPDFVVLHVFQMTNQSPEGTCLGGRGYPELWCLSLGKAGDQSRIGLVGLVSKKLGLSIGFDPGWIDDADKMAAISQEKGKLFPVAPGGFHDRMHMRNIAMIEPGR